MQIRLIRFLLVEDDDDHAAIVSRTLRQNRFIASIERVADGAEALAYVRQEGEYSDRDRPDVILLDLKLPKVDGHEVLLKLKEDEDLRSIPIIVLTTSNAESDRMRAYQHYANSYLVKPIDFSRFHQLIENLSEYWAAWNEPCPN